MIVVFIYDLDFYIASRSYENQINICDKESYAYIRSRKYINEYGRHEICYIDISLIMYE